MFAVAEHVCNAHHVAAVENRAELRVADVADSLLDFRKIAGVKRAGLLVFVQNRGETLHLVQRFHRRVRVAVEGEVVDVAAAVHDHFACDGGVDAARKEGENGAVASDGETARAVVGGVVDHCVHVADFDADSHFRSGQVDFQTGGAEHLFDFGRDCDLNVFGAERECFVAAARADAEADFFFFGEYRIEVIVDAGGDKAVDFIHVRFALKSGGEGFQTGTAAESLSDDREFLLREHGVVFLADVDASAHADVAERVELGALVLEVVDEFVFKHGPVVAFCGDFVIPADDAVVHGFPRRKRKSGNSGEIGVPANDALLLTSRFRRARLCGSDGSCRSGRCRSP